ncbi:hypothetical protein LMG27177_03753 [Paraburkholderia fynbosensis]|uniref:Spore coat protein U domain-containing protein n=2 Tax=Paraburkholderia fynbosensis TaxID=1200993 RepID=A0A6J5G9Z2_9BURK|nr:hypothetical protein LMG27177_03753 [Paraburkholderia fynbosensis]
MTTRAKQLQYGLYQDAAHSLALGSSAPATVNFYGLVTANQPTVPTTGNVSTTYSQTLSQTSLNYGFFLLIAPGCAALTTSAGSVGFTASAQCATTA